MAHTEQDMVAAWLNDAYGLEDTKMMLLKGFLTDFKDMPEVTDYFHERIEEAAEHKERVAVCLDMLGHKPSAGKSIFSKIAGALPGIGSSAFHDAKVKDLLALHAAGHLAHISFDSLAHAAKRIKQAEMNDICHDLGLRSRDLADWSLDHIAAVTDHVLDTATR